MKLIGEKQSYHKDSDETSVFFNIEIVARISELFLRKADLWTKEQETSYEVSIFLNSNEHFVS